MTSNPFEHTMPGIDPYEYPAELHPIEMHPRSQSVIDAREANRESLERQRHEQQREEVQREGRERLLAYFRGGGLTERQKSLTEALRSLHRVEAGNWTLRNTADALATVEAEMLRQAQIVAKPAVVAWAVRRRGELKVALAEAEGERQQKVAALEAEFPAGR